MRHARLLLLVLMAAFISAACATQSSSSVEPTAASQLTAESQQNATADPIRILRLDSYHVEFPWSQQIHNGVLAGLKDNGFEVDNQKVIFDEFYMDTKRNTSKEYFAEISAKTIEYIRTTKPDVVIASDDNAASLVVQPMRQEGIPFVILGLNGTPENYEFDNTANVTAVLERPHIQEMMDWIEQVFGERTRIAFLAEDSITTERMFGDGSIEQTVKDSANQFVEIHITSDYTDWQAYVEAAKANTDILYLGAYASLKQADGAAVEAVNALQWTLDNSEVPVMGFWEEAVHTGTLGGSVISGSTQGYAAGVKAAMILNGTPTSEIPHSIPPRGKLIINEDAMAKWSVQVPVELLEVSEIVGGE
jgi:ABC-type uncharacterized transport system substrate-binding protein